ncbi:biotin transporter BioY [Cereibacter sphaeroides]|uniref:biotin transporter BioY n=1 Tax=Cereibacter sphaeroides TaxID=1063 RepID=UPI001F3EF333|nr:biotin transporter BioY [Cereibacter sphaeroides]MCE6961260.1 biotin transporter BioY [Cereibacter sphaeroides]MCE6970246.1 biotin transporter BioY [Cereibacter sphaeroides]MCE6974015.1 biotin transporter BioY [Cereibacter sphaeroides]
MERNVTLIALFAALIAVLGLVPQITLMSGVPITAQSLGVMLCGTVLGGRRGALAVLLFLVLVFLGLPLLSGGRGGLGVLAGPTVGFIVGFPFAAFVAGLVVGQWRSAPVALASFVGCILGGIVVLYGFGVVGMAWKLGKTLEEAALLLTPYLTGDLLKCAIAALVTRGIEQVRPWTLISRS